MTKRLVDIDDELLAQARELTGAPTMKATVHLALTELVDAEQRRALTGDARYQQLIDDGVITPASRPKRDTLGPRIEVDGTVSDLVSEQRR